MHITLIKCIRYEYYKCKHSKFLKWNFNTEEEIDSLIWGREQFPFFSFLTEFISINSI